MSPSYGYGEAHPYWTMHPVQEVSEPYCYTERYWPSPAYPWKYWDGRSYEGSYPEWEEYHYGPNVNCAPPRYRGYRSPAYAYPPPPPSPRAFTYAHRPFHPSDQFRHPDEYPMRFVPVPLGYDYESFSPRIRAVKQEPLREMPNDKHCCGCPNHVCHSEGGASNSKQIHSKQDADGNSDGDKANHQVQGYPFPVVWFPHGHRQFPLDFNSNKSSEDDQKPIVDKSVQDGKLRPFPFFWMPPGLTLCKDDGNETAEVQNSDREKKNSDENICPSMSAEEQGKNTPKASDIPVKQIAEAKPSKEGTSGSVSAEELRKDLPRVKEIPVRQAGEERQPEPKKETRTKSSSPRAPRLPPVCLRIDPLHKKADGKSSSRSPSPRHKGSAAGTSEECVKKSDENALSNASRVSEETNTQKIEQQSNVQANKASEGGGCSSKKAHTMTAEAAATVIQSFYRGYQVRRLQPLRKLREISKIKGRVNELIGQMSNRELFAGLSRDVKAKERFSETLMGLLLQLDTIQGLHPVVRDMRKSVATEIVALQEKLDQLSIDCLQQIPFAAEATELQDHASEVSALNNCSEDLQNEQELVVDDKNSGTKQEAFSSSDIAGQKFPEEAPKQEKMGVSCTVEQTTETADDGLESREAKHENEETIQASDSPLESVTAEKGAASAEENVAERGNDSVKVKVEGEHQNKHYDPAEVNVAERGNDSVEVKVEGEHENGHFDSAEVKVESEHENKFQIQSLGGALDSDFAEKEGESAEAKVEAENENKHTVQAVDSMNAEEGNISTEQEAETKSENNDEKSSVTEKASVDGKSSVPVSEEESVEVNEIKSTASEKTEETELATAASISVEEKPIECPAPSAVVEEKPIECLTLTNNLKAEETFNPPLNVAFQSEEISAKSDELFTPAAEFESKGEESVPKCDEASNSSVQDKQLFVKCDDALNPAAQPESDKHAIEAGTPEGLEHSVEESQGKPECQERTDLNEGAHEVKCREDWEAENKRLKETVEKLLEAAKCQTSTIAELNEKLRHLEGKLSNGVLGQGRSSSRRSIKLKNKSNGVLRRRTSPTP